MCCSWVLMASFMFPRVKLYDTTCGILHSEVEEGGLGWGTKVSESLNDLSEEALVEEGGGAEARSIDVRSAKHSSMSLQDVVVVKLEQK